jgi:hypothetical protein
MPSSKKQSPSTAKTNKSKSPPKITSLMTSKKTSPPKKTGGSPKTPTKREPNKVSKPLSRTKKSKTLPKKVGGVGSPPQSPSKNQLSPRRNSQMTSPLSISRAEIPSIKLDDMPDELLGNILGRLDLKRSMKLKGINHSFAKKNLVIEPETLDLTRAKINKTLIDLLNKNSDKTKVNKLILDDITFEDEEGFNAFIEYFKNFKNVKELQICRFWSEQGKYKRINKHYNNYFILLIENIRFLENLEKLTIKSIDIEEENENNIEKSFSIVFIETLKLLVNLKHLTFEHNLISPDTSRYINSTIYGRPINGIRGINGIKHITTYEDEHNVMKKENGH